MLSSATDESEYSHDGNAVEDFFNGNWSSVNAHQTIWSSAYQGITYCNEVIDNWSNLEFDQFKLNLIMRSRCTSTTTISMRLAGHVLTSIITLVR